MNTFVTKLVAISNTVTDPSYVDNSPNGVFTSPKGTILQKAGNVISYKYPGDRDFTILNYASNSITALLNKYAVILNRGVNKNVTWVKEDSETGTKWAKRNTGVASLSSINGIALICCPPTPTPTSTPTPTPECTSIYCATIEYLYASYLYTTSLIIDSTGKCEPAPTDEGYYGEIRVCENYLYVYDGSGQWKRCDLTTYS